MAERSPQDASARTGFAWERGLEIEDPDPGRYPDVANLTLLDVIDGTPRRVLELGCASGVLAARLKERHPGATVVGIEPGRAAAELAATRLDRVIRARIEDVDFGAEGLQEGGFDTIVAGDVLEHLVNPWRVLERLRPLLAPGGQLVASIPNVRNALLIAALAVNGRWEYRDRGLLDITHLRFFTLEEIRRLFEQTGYRYERHLARISPPLAELHRQQRGRPRITLQLGRLTLADLTPAELDELCTEQFCVRVRPAP